MALLALLCAGAIVAAVLVVGPPSAAKSESRTVTAERGVVQSTVSGSGTIEARETDVNFPTGGQLTDVSVKAGQHVVEGQVLAHIQSSDAQLSLDEAEANLRSAKAKLTQAEAQATAASSSSSPQATSAANKGTTGPPTGTTGSTGQNSSSSNSSSSSSSSTNSAATKAANEAAIASAQAGVDSAQAAVNSAEQAVSDTELTAPVSGTVASVNAGVGDYVSGGGSNNNSSSSSSSNSSSGNGSSNGNGQDNGSSNGNSSSSNSSSSSSSSAFVVIVDMHHLDLLVPFSESDIHKIKLHQPATVTVNALPSEKLAAHVTAIDTLPTTNSGVTSYNVTFRLDQGASGLKPGMTASASVVIQRVDDAVNVATAAISRGGGGSSVTLLKNGKTVRQAVTTGITGDSTTQVLSGLNPGDQVEVPIVTSGAVAGGSSSGTGRLGGGGLGGGGGALFGGGGARFGGGGGGGGAIAIPKGGGGP